MEDSFTSKLREFNLKEVSDLPRGRQVARTHPEDLKLV